MLGEGGGGLGREGFGAGGRLRRGGCPGAGLRCRRDARGRGMEAGTGETEAARPPNPPRTGHSGTEPSAVADGITLVGKRQKETNARPRIERPRPDPVPQRSAGPGAGAALPGTVRGVSLPVGQRRRSFYFPSPLDSLNGLIIRSQPRASGRACPGAAPHSSSAAAAAGLSSGSSRKAPRDPSALGAEKEKKKQKTPNQTKTKPTQNQNQRRESRSQTPAALSGLPQVLLHRLCLPVPQTSAFGGKGKRALKPPSEEIAEQSPAGNGSGSDPTARPTRGYPEEVRGAPL